jgi:hypothetical protein
MTTSLSLELVSLPGIVFGLHLAAFWVAVACLSLQPFAEN